MNKIIFELIPTLKKEELEYYKEKLKEFKTKATLLNKDGYEVPLIYIKQGLYYSKTIRRLKRELGIDENEN
jgi:hypothetical protein